MKLPEGMSEPIVREGVEPTEEEVDKVISSSVGEAFTGSKGTVGVLLSGGVDSTLLLHYVNKYGRVQVFTVATDMSHPDLEAAEKVAKEYDLEHHVLLPSSKELEEAKQELSSRGSLYKGDAGVYLALKLAKSKGIGTIIATDGIDEIVGGYWWHTGFSDKVSSKEEAFETSWAQLGPDHVEPLLDSADRVGIEVKFPFLDRRVVTTLNRIPLDKRVEGRVPKSWWKSFASKRVPQHIVSRPKVGGCDILDESITSTLPSSIQWETDYSVSPQRIRRLGNPANRRVSSSVSGRISSKEVRL